MYKKRKVKRAVAMSKKRKVKTELVENIKIDPDEKATPIAKPGKFDINKFKSKRSATIAGVETLQTALPHHPLAQAGDFVRLHPDEENFWSSELCFVNVPIKGVKNGVIHLIEEDVAMRNLPSQKIQRFRLALATKPHDVFFLCHVPSQNLDNAWNATNLQGCEQAKTLWTELTSRKAEGVDGYKISFARNREAFPEPTWPVQSLDTLIEVTFNGRMIDTDDNPGLLRLIGDVQLP